ncbi:hypothetical protein RE654_00020 [Aeromonas caviae]|uniref:hypothetical protein n=1 Tax=Aeromonas caviae TaxID=648 RepID=UPI0028689396|nr:hypothetical protein [Aeromonas caviae]WMX34703.1 hypothetical protein RE654_00020 [Aeromonas caviae]
MALSKFQESLLVMAAMKNNMENDLRVFKRYIHDDDLKYTIHNKMILDICSFLNEWKRFNIYSKNSESIRETMKITAPAIRRLKRWRGIEGMRNTMLAHGFRDEKDDGKPTCMRKRYFEADVPTSYAEVMLLSEYCVYVISAFICRHSEEYQSALNTIPMKTAHVQRGIDTMLEFDAALKELQEHMFGLDPNLKQCFGV